MPGVAGDQESKPRPILRTVGEFVLGGLISLGAAWCAVVLPPPQRADEDSAT